LSAQTPSQTVGPYYSIGLCQRPDNELAAPEEPGTLHVVGELLDGEGVPIFDGMIEVWQVTTQRWGRCGTHPDGRFSFVLEKPPAADGEAPRLDVYVHARGLLKHQLTRMYFPDEVEANAADPVLAALAPDDRATLVAEREDDGALRFDIRMQGPRQTVFFAV
jgi:protocatechuate 3,4-dioxygenase, alpha subunit